MQGQHRGGGSQTRLAPRQRGGYSRGRAAGAVERSHSAIWQRVQQVVETIEKATFTGKGDKAVVRALYKGYVERVATVLAATLAQWVGLRGDPVGLSVLAGDSVRWSWLPPGSGAAQLGRIHRVLAEARPHGRADLGDALLLEESRAALDELTQLLELGSVYSFQR